MKHCVTSNIYVGSDKLYEKYLLHHRVLEQISTSLTLINFIYIYFFFSVCSSHIVIFFVLTKQKFEMSILNEISCCNLRIEFDWLFFFSSYKDI